ncbi:MAG: hypothetical protein ACI8P3_000610 [Saprospiraceae bacterium]|jgi:hypothetical protein
MKTLFYLSISIFVLSCSLNKTAATENKNIDSVVELKTNSSFDQCFSAPDPTFKQTAIGCSGAFYKVINDQFVLRISPDLNMNYDECTELKIGISDQKFIAQLLIFEKGKASLSNICTDVINENAAKPIITFDKCIGSLTIGKSDPTDYHGNERPKVTIRIDELIFINLDSNEEIAIRNQLIWKVLNIGTPGGK